jgi:hypothetical protein
MSIDDRARAATAELQDTTLGAALPPVSVIMRAQTQRRRARLGLLVAVCAGLAIAALLPATRSAVAPSAPSAPSPGPTASASFGLACRLPGITCSDGRITVSGQLPSPVSFIPTPGLNTDDIAPGDSMVALRRIQGGRPSGVTVFEGPTPVEGTRDRAVAALTGANASTTATWLATLPFVQPTTPEETSVGGLHAYRVDVTLRPGAATPGFALGSAAALTFITDGGLGDGTMTAVSHQLKNTRYYLVDVPHHGLVVIWVWAIDGTVADLGSMTALVDSIRFG